MEKIFFLTKEYMYEYYQGKVSKKNFQKEKGIYTSIIYFKDIFTRTFKFSTDLSEEELLIKAEESVYNEVALDLEKEYKIVYQIQKIEKSYLVDAFIVEVDKLKEEFKPFLKKVKYIDFISAAPFIFKEYYEIVNLLPKNDIFIYFTPIDAFVVGFKNKEFLFAKSLDKFSSLSRQLQLDNDKVIEILREKGLDKSLYEDEEIYIKIDKFFSQFFMKVNNLANYTKSFYRLERIDRIFFYSNIEIRNLIENYENFWHLSGIEFKKFEIETTYDPFEYCATIYNAKNYLNEKENFSIFKRPPKFYKTEIGKLTIFFLFFLFLILVDALYKFYIISSTEKKIKNLQFLLSEKEKKLKYFQHEIKNYNKKIQEEKNLILNIEKQINDIATKISYLYFLKIKKPFYNEIADVINFLNENNLYLVSFEKKNEDYVIIIKSSGKNSSLIPKFINYLISRGYRDVSSQKIENEKGDYITQIKFRNE